MPERTDELEQLLRDVTRFFGLMHDAIHEFQLPPEPNP